ncbi:MAG: hypothetical protein KAJ75_00455 [Alphaproteobacteria bacterium]|nr:hypothetical protein [Alphaproteobacteria bacterium]
MVNALTATSFDNMSLDNIMIDNIKQQAARQFAEKTVAIDEKYQTSFDRLDKEKDKYINVLASINNAKMAMENGQKGIEEIKGIMLEMRSTLSIIKESDGDTAFLEQYNEHIRKISTTANLYSEQFNSIGKADEFTGAPNTIEYKEDLSGRMISKEGVDLSAGFKIDANDGTTWVVDFSSNSIVQREGYDAAAETRGDLTGKDTSINTGLTLVSYDESTGAIEATAMVNGVEETITGTLENSGLNLMGAWFYNDFETDEDIARAYSDINKAGTDVVVGQAQIEMNFSSIRLSENKAKEVMDGYKEDRKDKMYSQMEEQQKLQYEVEKQYQAMLINLDSMQKQQANYVSVFGSAIESNPMLDLLL